MMYDNLTSMNVIINVIAKTPTLALDEYNMHKSSPLKKQQMTPNLLKMIASESYDLQLFIKHL